MFAIELLKTYAPDEERRQKAKVWDYTVEHLTYAEREAITTICEACERASNTLAAFSMQHVGPVGDALDLGATIASAGEALCQFVLTRALLNPHELAAAKCGIAECWLNVSDLLATFCDNEEYRLSTAGLDAAQKFLNTAVPLFVPLFEDLERHARARFPHLGAVADLGEKGSVNV
jgi:hypothetical protein